MESLIALYQLTILYMLKRAAGEVTMTMISDFLLEYGYVNFESLLTTYEELRTNGYVDVITRGDRTFLSITEEGREALGFFRKQIPAETIRQVDSYLKEHGRKLSSDRNVLGEYYKGAYGGYLVHMCVKEDQTMLFELNVNVPSEKMARSVLGRWRKDSDRIYQTVMAELFSKKTPEKESGTDRTGTAGSPADPAGDSSGTHKEDTGRQEPKPDA